MAVTVLLLVVAALLTRSFIAAQRTNAGFAVNTPGGACRPTPAMLRYSGGAQPPVLRAGDRDA